MRFLREIGGAGYDYYMDGSLKLGERMEARYASMVMRVEQREDHLWITVHDSRSAQPNAPVWHGEEYRLEDAMKTALQAARGYLADPEQSDPLWQKAD